MLPELGPYLAMWNLISTEVYKGQSLQILERGGAHDNDLDVFAAMEAEQNAWRLERARNKK